MAHYESTTLEGGAELYELLLAMLDPDARRRPSAGELLRHPALAGRNGSAASPAVVREAVDTYLARQDFAFVIRQPLSVPIAALETDFVRTQNVDVSVFLRCLAYISDVGVELGIDAEALGGDLAAAEAAAAAAAANGGRAAPAYGTDHFVRWQTFEAIIASGAIASLVNLGLAFYHRSLKAPSSDAMRGAATTIISALLEFVCLLLDIAALVKHTEVLVFALLTLFLGKTDFREAGVSLKGTGAASHGSTVAYWHKAPLLWSAKLFDLTYEVVQGAFQDPPSSPFVLVRHYFERAPYDSHSYRGKVYFGELVRMGENVHHLALRGHEHRRKRRSGVVYLLSLLRQGSAELAQV